MIYNILGNVLVLPWIGRLQSPFINTQLGLNRNNKLRITEAALTAIANYHPPKSLLPLNKLLSAGEIRLLMNPALGCRIPHLWLEISNRLTWVTTILHAHWKYPIDLLRSGCIFGFRLILLEKYNQSGAIGRDFPSLLDNSNESPNL